VLEGRSSPLASNRVDIDFAYSSSRASSPGWNSRDLERRSKTQVLVVGNCGSAARVSTRDFEGLTMAVDELPEPCGSILRIHGGDLGAVEAAVVSALARW
jgi:hypothetical protein